MKHYNVSLEIWRQLHYCYRGNPSCVITAPAVTQCQNYHTHGSTVDLSPFVNYRGNYRDITAFPITMSFSNNHAVHKNAAGGACHHEHRAGLRLSPWSGIDEHRGRYDPSTVKPSESGRGLYGGFSMAIRQQWLVVGPLASPAFHLSAS